MGTCASATVTSSPYRAGDSPWVHERALLLAEREEASRGLTRRPLASMWARRWARAGAGMVLVLGALVLLAMGAAHLFVEMLDNKDIRPPYTVALLVTLGVSAATWAVLRFAMPFTLRGRVALRFEPSGDARLDVARLAARPAASDAIDLVDALERRSLAWPLVGASLVVPITLHYVVSLFLSLNMERFDFWVVLSLALTLPAHGTLAYFASRLAKDPDHGPTALRAWGFTVLASLFPGVLLLGIPPVLVAVTGLFIPVMFCRARHAVAAERLLLGHAREELRTARGVVLAS